MQPLFPVHPNECRPLRIVPPGNAGVGRLGGPAPEGILTDCRFRFLLTVECYAGASASVFVASFDDLLAFGGHVHRGLTGGVDIVFHPPGRPGSEAGLFLSTFALAAGEPCHDVVQSDTGEWVVRSDHKQGGQPHVMQSKRLLDDARCLLEDGYVQFIQLDFPGKQDVDIDEEWPFADGMFHGFVRWDAVRGAEWAYFTEL